MSLSAAQRAIQNGTVKVEDGLEALDAAVQAKFGDLARAQLLEFNFQLQKARENVGRIFGAVNVERFREALQDVLSILDQSTITGRALRAIAETALNPLFDWLAKGGPIAKAFFQGLVIGALLVIIAVLKVRNALRDAFGGSVKSAVDWVKTAMYAGVIAMALMTAGAVALAAALAVVAVSVLLFLSPFLILAGVAVLVGAAIGSAITGIVDGFSAAVDFIKGLDFAELGANIVDGLVNGITNGVGRVVAAVKGLGKSAMATFKSTLGIASPSRPFREFGGFTAEGFALGVEENTGRVRAAVDAMVTIPSKPSAPRIPTVNAKSGGNTYNFYISGVSNAETLKEPSFLARLAEVLEGATLQAGAPLTPEASEMPNPLDDADLYDYIVLAKQRSPGLCDVSGASAPRQWDIRKGYGLSGATVVYTGDGLAQFTVRLFFWETSHFDEWERFRVLIAKPPEGEKPKAMDISHPYLEELGIKSVVVDDELQWAQPEPGLFIKDIKFLQYRAPKPALGKPDGSQSKANEPTAETEAERVIQSLTKQMKELAA